MEPGATPRPCARMASRLAGVVGVPGELLQDLARHLAQARRVAVAMAEHLAMKEHQQQRIGEDANHGEHHEGLIVLLVHCRMTG